ncbi:MAG: trypsin-like peptidase domain-containing protein [Thiothrix sp.]|uniref:trypsin-like peptidase domain-containing protein n=1 Tax=Thiothrix sp. TaxID=1032 RepID=UPI0026360FF0|nr:trypsin-like peptidase domain-containing protein [Thiothrix sp.]MDD5395261.1 trypsin-like peptidase domain-containing protein [Thiothrix sp.]
MDTTLIAKILPTKQAKYGGKRTVGTGYPIGKNLVLTARHVVVFPERDETKPITVEWPDLGHKDENAKIVFDGGVDCDVAILECQIPPQAQVSPLLLARQPPVAHVTWESFGYPAIGKDEDGGDVRKKISALGKFHAPDSASHEISLTSESDALEKAGWRGISGAPVFHGRVLYAVITSTPTNRAACFNAVSIPWLLADKSRPNFRERVGIDGVEQHFDSSIKHLQDHRDVKASLYFQIRLIDNHVIDSPENIIRYLVRLTIPQLLGVVRDAQKASASLSVRQELGNLVRLLLPSLYGFDCITTIRVAKGNASVGILEIPYATEISADILMAGVDQRPANFSVNNRKQSMPGAYRLSLPPETGAETTDQQQHDIDDDLYRRIYGGVDLDAIQIALDEHLYKNIYPRLRPPRTPVPEVKKKLVRAWFEDDATEKRPSYYWLLNLSGNEEDDVRLQQLAQGLKASYPHITLLSLDMDESGDRQIMENRTFNLLADTSVGE